MKVQSGILTERRREFIKQAGGLSAIAFLGPAFFTSCGSDDDAQPNGANTGEGISISANQVLIDLDKQSQLKQSGAWLLIPGAKVLVVNDAGYKALTSVCTHDNCDTQWAFGNGQFTCTCHGSRFSTTGAVTNGPALRDLTRYSTSVENNTLKIQK